MVLEEDGRCFAVATATEASAEQIAYATPTSSILAWFANHWKKGERIGRFPRWDFDLLPRTDAWEQEHSYPSSLDGAIVCGLRKSCTFPQIQNGDVLLSIHRQGSSVELDKFGLVTDHEHGEPRFSIHNIGFVSSLHPKLTTVTVWRPSLKQKRTFKCAPGPQLSVGRSYYQEYAPPPYACLGSMVFMNGTPDLLGPGDDDSDEECDSIPAVQTFHIMRHVHAQRDLVNPKPVVVLSHFHPNAYVSSTRTLAQGDIVQKINNVTVKDVEHAEKLIRKLAVDLFTPSGKKTVCICTPGKRVWLDLRKLLQEETLCVSEREPSKMHLLKACATAADIGSSSTSSKPQRRSRRVKDHRAVSALTIATAKALQETLVNATPKGTNTSHKRGRRSRSASPSSSHRTKPTKRRRSKRLATTSS